MKNLEVVTVDGVVRGFFIVNVPVKFKSTSTLPNQTFSASEENYMVYTKPRVPSLNKIAYTWWKDTPMLSPCTNAAWRM